MRPGSADRPDAAGQLAVELRQAITAKQPGKEIERRLDAVPDEHLGAALRILLEEPQGLFADLWWMVPPGHRRMSAKAVFGTARARRLLARADGALLAAGALTARYESHGESQHASNRRCPIIAAAIDGAPPDELPGVAMAVELVIAHTNRLAEGPRMSFLSPPRLVLDMVGRLRPGRPELAWTLLGELAAGNTSLGWNLRKVVPPDGSVPEHGEALLRFVELAADLRGSAPSAGWRRRWEEMLARSDPGLHDVLVQLAGDGRAPGELQLGGPGADLGRAAVIGLGSWDDPATSELLVQTVLAWARSGVGSPSVGSAAVWALASRGSRQAMLTLLDLRRRIRHRSLLKRLDQEVQRLANELRIAPADLADEAVDDCGLGPSGSRAWALGEYRVVLRLDDARHVVLEVTSASGEAHRDVPSSVRRQFPKEWSAVSAATRLLKETVSTQRGRLEEAMVGGRTWSREQWDRAMRGHPILSKLARAIVWEAIADGRRQLVIPSGGGWSAEAAVELDAGAALRIAHPATMSERELAYWQRRIVTERLVQPFKQVFRETYLVTGAEIEEGDRSHRFSGHVIPNQLTYALARSRGWAGTAGLSGFHGAGRGTRVFPTWGVRARLEQDWAAGGDFGTISEVFFERGDGDQRWTRMPIGDVPRIPFSEAMRDVDLIVAVASIGTDQQWLEWEARREAGGVDWTEQRRAYASLATAASAVRGRLLEELLPLLGVADRVRVEGHFANVRGRLSEYRIHLGSGNIHMEPSGRYLCIVLGRSEDDRTMYLPFEDPELKSAEIISKVMLLVKDDEIVDPVITGQLRRRDD